VLLGPIISRLFTCSNAENKLKKTKGACSSPISMEWTLILLYSQKWRYFKKSLEIRQNLEKDRVSKTASDLQRLMVIVRASIFYNSSIPFREAAGTLELTNGGKVLRRAHLQMKSQTTGFGKVAFSFR
jgi:hypothetical protein